MKKASRKHFDPNFTMSVVAKCYGRLFPIYLLPQWPQIVSLSACMFAIIALSLVNPHILKSFIDAIFVGANLSSLPGMATLYLVVAIIRQVIAVYETYLAENISLRATNRLRADLTLHCLQLDLSFHAAHTPGELIERIDGDVAVLSNFFSRFQVSLIGNTLLLAGVLLMLFRIDWRVGLALSFFTTLSLVVVSRLHNIPTPHWEAERQASGKLFGFLEERLSGREDILSNGASSYMIRGLAEQSRMVLRTFRRAVQVNSLAWGSIIFLFTIGTTITLALDIYLFNLRTISIGTAYMIFAYTILLNTPIEEIVLQLRDLQQASGSIIRILALLDTKSTIKDNGEGTLPGGALTVAFEDVSFGYADHVPVLQHISFSLQPGEVVGLLGRTGSGKSTLAKLLVRLYDPDTGTICLGGNNLRALKLDDIRQRIGMVPQDVHVLHASVRDNLTLFDDSIDDELIVRTLEELGLGPWYRLLPRGLDTKLASGAEGLSAGEMQLLSFARVFLRDPGLIILDEASSRLDPATEGLLEQTIDRLLAGRTAIIIAHRLATVQRAHTILILENGRCREYGAREELARNPCSCYSHLLHTSLEEAPI